MRMVECIEDKRDGHELSEEAIQFIIKGVTDGSIPDYQISAWLMAVYFQGMTEIESYHLTKAMLESGEQIDLTAIEGIKVDKHSTGGVGDKTTLALAPLVAAMGGKMAKLSGRGLGHTGGTIDKLESIPGFNVSLSAQAFKDQVNAIGCAVAGQTADVAPADKILYALRDVTGTVPSIPLIAASIMAKKLASGADVIVLDVKVGDGAFMKSKEDAILLAKRMVKIGEMYGKKVSAFLTNMDEPLGYAIGNRLEVLEAMDTLKGKGPKDFTELVVALAATITFKAGLFASYDEANQVALQKLSSLEAYTVFESFVKAQEGDLAAFFKDPGLKAVSLTAQSSGTIGQMDALELGLHAMHLGAGRATKDDEIDPRVGLRVLKKVGDAVQKGETLVEVYAAHPFDGEAILKAITIQPGPVQRPALIIDTIGIHL